MSKLLRALLEKKQALLSASNAITTKAGDETRELTAEELKTVNDNLAAITNLNTQIEAEKANIEAARSMEGVVIQGNAITGTEDRAAGTHGFESFGAYLSAVRAAGGQNPVVDPRLNYRGAAPSTYGNENVGVDGGFAVPMDFSSEIVRHSLEEDSLLAMCEDNPVSGNSITYPMDETTPWGTDGVRVYWDGEADTATGTKPKIKPNTMRLNKLLGIVPLTDELIDDAPAMAAYVQNALGISIRWKANDAIVNGTGAGQPLGLGSAGNAALVVVSKESGQAANTFVAANAAKMFARMPAAYLSGAVWLANPEILPQLLTMTIGNQPIWTPPNAGFKDAPGGLLLGKPVLPTQTCQALSSQGDIYFVNLKQYRTISKRGAGIQLAQSMHLYFDAGLTAFRATFRLDGQPKFKSYIAPARGSANLSPYVTLQVR